MALRRKRISKVGDRSGGTVACPKCGGSDLAPRRSRRAKVVALPTLGLSLTRRTRLKCVTCGAVYKRS
ncbi:MAG: hypothetical protein ABI276_03500 [Acidimicrobiales bacterium]